MQNEFFQFQLTKLFRVRDTSCPKEKYVQEENIAFKAKEIDGYKQVRIDKNNMQFWKIVGSIQSEN